MQTAPTRDNLLLAVLSALALAACGGSSDDAQTTIGATGCVAQSEQISVVSGEGQVAPPGALLPVRLTARVTCESSTNRGTTIALAGAWVEWSAGSDGLVDGTGAIYRQTDSDGLASVAWTLPHRFGTQTVTASVLGPALRTVLFSATAIVSTTTAQTCLDAGGSDHGSSTRIASNAVWEASGSPHRGGTIVLDNAMLTIEPGAVVCVSEIETLVSSTGFVSAVGTAQLPIRIFGTAMRASSELTHVRGENMPFVGTAAHPSVWIEDSTFRWTEPRDPLACVQLVVGDSGTGAGATLRRSLISGYGSPDCAALRLIYPQNTWLPFWEDGGTYVEVRILGSVGDAVSVLPTPNPLNPLNFTNCEMSSSGRHGIVVTEPSGAGAEIFVAVSACNLFGNGGDAIANQSTVAVEAEDNWWGDVTGPLGPDGDGVSGAVNVTSPRPAPVPVGY